MKKKIISIILVLGVGLIIRFWTGMYHHDEFAETELFIKHRPIWKWTFYSPIGQSDLMLKDLSEEERREQLLFDEFVSSKGMSK